MQGSGVRKNLYRHLSQNEHQRSEAIRLKSKETRKISMF